MVLGHTHASLPTDCTLQDSYTEINRGTRSLISSYTHFIPTPSKTPTHTDLSKISCYTHITLTPPSLSACWHFSQLLISFGDKFPAGLMIFCLNFLLAGLSVIRMVLSQGLVILQRDSCRHRILGCCRYPAVVGIQLSCYLRHSPISPRYASPQDLGYWGIPRYRTH